MYLNKETKLSIKFTFIMLFVIAFLLAMSVAITWYFVRSLQTKDFIEEIEFQYYQNKYLVEENNEDDENLTDDEHFYNPNIDYFLKENGEIIRFWRANKLKFEAETLLKLLKWNSINKYIWESEYLFYNDTNSEKIYLEELDIIEIQRLLYEAGFFFIFILILPLYFLATRVVKIYLKPIEEANNRLKHYNYNLAHELRTPISAIGLNFDVLKWWYDEQYILDSRKELKNMHNIVDSLLKLSERSVKENLEHINVLEEIRLFKLTLNKKERVLIYTDVDEKLTIISNKVLFFRLLDNIIKNWLKYSTDWKLYIQSNKNWITFKNKVDLSINNSNLNDLNDYFFRWKNSWFKEWFGLWLSIVKAITEELWYENNIEIKDGNFIITIKFN